MSVFKGWNAQILKDGSTIGYAESASVEIATGLEPYYQIGSRQPATLIEGNEEVTGSISRAWINTDYLALVAPSAGGALTEFTLVFQASNVAGSPEVHCYKCKFETGALDIPQDGFLKEDYDFRATTVSIDSVAA